MYRDIVFIQSTDDFSDFEHYLDISEDVALVYLMQWFHEDGELRKTVPMCMGYGDYACESDGFLMIYNRSHGCVGLWAKV